MQSTEAVYLSDWFVQFTHSAWILRGSGSGIFLYLLPNMRYLEFNFKNILYSAVKRQYDKWNNFMWDIMGKCLTLSVSPTKTHRLRIILWCLNSRMGKNVIVCIATIFLPWSILFPPLYEIACGYRLDVSNKGNAFQLLFSAARICHL